MQIVAKGSTFRESFHEVNHKNKKSLKANIENIEKKRTEIHSTADELLDAHIHSLNVHSKRLGDAIRERKYTFEQDESAVLKMMDTFKRTSING